MNLLINGNFEHIDNNLFRRALIASVTDPPDFDSQKKKLTGFSFPVVKGYLVKSKLSIILIND